MVAKAHLVCVTKNRVNKGLQEMLLSQLSTVQTDHHKPTYWFVFSLFLHGLPERLLLCLKNKMKQPPKKPNQKKTQKNPHQTNKPTNHQTHPNLYIHVVTRDPQQSTPMCNAGTGKPLQRSCGHPVVCAMWVLGAGQCQRPKSADPTSRLPWVSQHWGQRLKWELPLVTAMVLPSLVLRDRAQKLWMSLHKLHTLIYD